MANLMNILFHEAVKIHVLNKGTALSAAKYPTSGNFKLVSGLKRFAIVGIVNAVDSELTIQVQQATAVNGTPKNITGAVKVVPSTTENGKWFSIEVEVAHMDINNNYKYVTVDVAGAAGSNDTVTILFLELVGNEVPVTQPSDCAENVVLVG